MKINVTWFDKQFNVELSSADGKEPFLVVKGCRIVDGRNGEFVSWPARKLDSGKFWQHVYASEAFAVEVLKAAKASMPDTRTHSERKARQDDSDVPF